ncbi:MAG TPA: ABC transporter permease [Gemmatimonadaceae bacterium]|nr:ABC transporter permease [Gemmatimonadaceae bacterium]
MIENALQDLRYAVRGLRRGPGFTLVAVLTLALGIGATTTIYSIVNAVVLRPLPFRTPERLVRVWDINPHGGDFSTSDATYLDLRERNRSFAQVAAFSETKRSAVLTGGCAPATTVCEPQRLESSAVTSSIFPLLGIAPAIGRTFTTMEDRPGGDNNVVVIGHDLWEHRFASDPGIIGRTIVLDGRSHTVVGVMPPGFAFPTPTSLWVPLVLNPARDRDEHDLTVIARLGPRVTLDGAAADVRRVARELGSEYPRTNGGWSARVERFGEWLIGPRLERGVFVLFGAVGFLLLMACANIANLLIARGSARRSEIAIRAALGASRWRIARQLLTESLLLGILGSAVGLGMASWAVALVRTAGPANIPRLDDVAMDSHVLLFTLALALITSLLFGLIPALQVSRVELNRTLEHGSRDVAPRGRARARGALVVVQVSLAMILLVGAGLMFASFIRLQAVPTGYDASNVITVPLDLPDERYNDAKRLALLTNVRAGIAGIPGVQYVGATSTDPLRQWGYSNDVTPVDRAAEAPAGGYMQAGWRSVTPGYFRALGITLVNGRVLTDADAASSEQPVVITRGMANSLWPGESAVGKQLYWGGTDGEPHTVVGVVGDIRDVRLDAEPGPIMFLPYGAVPVSAMTLVIRTSGAPSAVVTALRREIREADPLLPLPEIGSLTGNRAAALAEPRFRMLLLGGFAAAALLLAVLGVYGLMAFAVAQRTRELGVRIALGAHAPRIFTLVLRQGMLLAGIGVLAGLAGALALTRVLRSLLFDMSATDPVVIGAVAIVLGAATLMGAWFPARRAARIEPVAALREE